MLKQLCDKVNTRWENNYATYPVLFSLLGLTPVLKPISHVYFTKIINDYRDSKFRSAIDETYLARKIYFFLSFSTLLFAIVVSCILENDIRSFYGAARLFIFLIILFLDYYLKQNDIANWKNRMLESLDTFSPLQNISDTSLNQVNIKKDNKNKFLLANDTSIKKSSVKEKTSVDCENKNYHDSIQKILPINQTEKCLSVYENKKKISPNSTNQNNEEFETLQDLGILYASTCLLLEYFRYKAGYPNSIDFSLIKKNRLEFVKHFKAKWGFSDSMLNKEIAIPKRSKNKLYKFLKIDTTNFKALNDKIDNLSFYLTEKNQLNVKKLLTEHFANGR